MVIKHEQKQGEILLLSECWERNAMGSALLTVWQSELLNSVILFLHLQIAIIIPTC